MKKYIVTFLLSFLIFALLGGVFANFVFLPEFANWHTLYPEAVRATPDFISGFPVALIQIIGLIALIDRLKIATLSSGAVFGAVFSAGIWLIVDLQMVSTTTFVSYSYVGLDAVLSAIMGAVGGGVVAWSLKKFA